MSMRWGGGTAELECPACGATGQGELVLSVPLGRSSVPGPSGAAAPAQVVLRCPGCDVLVLPPLGGWSAAEQDEADVDEQVESGYALEAMLARLTMVEPRPGRRLLDVGCGFGFGADLARFAWGWDVVGVDPSLAGRRGSEALGLPIFAGPLGAEDDARGPGYDVVLASEVLEHVDSPAAFLAAVRARLDDSGVLLLSTPDAASVHPGTAEPTLRAVLSVGHHRVLFGRDNVESLLVAAGFRDVTAWVERETVLAVASPGPPGSVTVRRSAPLDLDLLVRYCDARAGEAPAGSPLQVGMAVRHLQFAVNAGRFDEAQRGRARLRAALLARHGIDVDRPASLAGDRCPLPASAVVAHYHLGMLELAAFDRPRLADQHFSAASWGASRTRLGLSGVDMAQVALLGAGHAALSSARAPDGPVADALARFTSAIDKLTGCWGSQVAALSNRVFTELVSGGRYADASALEATWPAPALQPLDPEGPADLARSGLDALFCRGMLAYHTDRVTEAAAWFGLCAKLAARSEDEGASELARWAIEHEELALARMSGQAVVVGPASAEARPVPAAVELYWSDIDGTRLRGWVDVEASVAREVTVHAGGARRVRLEPAADRSGQTFDAYVPGAPSGTIRLELHRDGEPLVLTLPAPAERVPPWPATGPSAAGGEAGWWERSLARLEAESPPGPIVVLGPRGHPGSQLDRALRTSRRLVIGLDIHPGPLVDLVADVHGLSRVLRPGSVAAVVSSSVLEHLELPWVVAAELHRALVHGGMTLHGAPVVWPEHAAPTDFWRFSRFGLEVLFGPAFGFEVLDLDEGPPVAVVPSPTMRDAHADMPLLVSPSTAGVLARKLVEADELPGPAPGWPGARLALERRPRRYPVDGLVPPPVAQPAMAPPVAAADEAPVATAAEVAR